MKDQRISIAIEHNMKTDLQKLKHVFYKESLNSFILEILRNYVARHKDDIEKFDRQKAEE